MYFYLLNLATLTAHALFCTEDVFWHQFFVWGEGGETQSPLAYLLTASSAGSETSFSE